MKFTQNFRTLKLVVETFIQNNIQEANDDDDDDDLISCSESYARSIRAQR